MTEVLGIPEMYPSVVELDRSQPIVFETEGAENENRREDQNPIRRNAHVAYPYPPQLVTSTPSALIPAMMRSGTTRAGGQS